MGTTRTAVQAGGGVSLKWIVAIEGYPYLLTNGSTSAAVTAWSGTDWSQALGGLAIQWSDGQQIKPWSKDLSIQSVRLAVQPDASDTFGIDVFGSARGNETRLTASLAVDTTTASVESTSAFGASGSIYIGTEHITYTGKTATTFTGLTRGVYFGSGGCASRVHTVPEFEDEVTIKPVVTSAPRVWTGRYIWIYAHREVGGVLDVRAQAELVFFGRITGTADDETGLTWVEADDVRALVQDAMLMRDQWTALVRDGVYLRKGLRFKAKDLVSTTYETASELEVVESGATAPNEIDAGVYTYESLTSAIARWLSAERTAGRLNMRYTIGLITDEAGLRSQIQASPGSVATDTHRHYLFTFPEIVVKFLGFGAGEQYIAASWNGVSHNQISPETPYRRLFGQMVADLGDIRFYYDGERGEFFDNKDHLPADLRPDDSGTFGVLQLDTGEVFLARKQSGYLEPALVNNALLNQLAGQRFDWGTQLESRMDSAGKCGIRQIAVLSGSFVSLTMAMLASTGTAGENGTSDTLPAQLGAAIPSSVITTIEEDLDALQSASEQLFVVVEKPTKLWNVIGCEFLLRAANLVWKNGELRAPTWSTPTATSALHTFLEANKAEASTVSDPTHRTTARDDDSYVVNLVKIQYNRTLKGSGESFDSSVTVADLSAMDEHGTRPVTIQARNTFAGIEATTDTVDHLASYIAGFLPLFSRPLRVLRRSIGLPHFLGVGPGDQCTLTDSHVRNPSTGTRGVTGKPGLVIGHRIDFGGFEFGANEPRPMVGEVDILIYPRDRVATYCPAAEVDQTAGGGGYNAGTKVLTFHANEHTSTGTDVDHFDVTDAVYILEVDPSNPAAPLQWQDTIAAKGTNTVTLTTGLAGFDATKRYRMLSQKFTLATATQKAHVYQADDADGLIENVAQAYEYGWQATNITNWSDDVTTRQVELGPTVLVYGDGAPLDTGYERSMARLVNNLISHRTAPSIPSIGVTASAASGSPATAVRSILRVERIVMGPGQLLACDRKLWVRPFYRSATGASVTLTVSLCREFPVGTGRCITSTTFPEYVLVGPYESTTYTTTSATWQHGAAYGFSFRNLDGNGCGWLVWEGTPQTQVRGSSVGRAGPFLDV